MINKTIDSKISILGSTGSIGTQALDVAMRLNIPVLSLAAHSNSKRLEEQARKFKPRLVALFDESAAADLKIRLADTSVKVRGGESGVIEAAAGVDSDRVVAAIVGIAGLTPTLEAIRAGKHIALANKETLVCAGELVKREASLKGVKIIPIDSEHSAIYRCIGSDSSSVPMKILLTASGGPFFGKELPELQNVTIYDTLKHPNWNMGPKISVDSATMMNKGLELIEAMHLFEKCADDIEIVIHPQSILHSLVEYRDGAMIAQLGTPDMRTPICYALTENAQSPSGASRLKLTEISKLTFFEPDYETFPAPLLARRAAKLGGTAPTVLNGANEEAVNRFLNGEISFLQITEFVRQALSQIPISKLSSLDMVFEYDAIAREAVKSM